VNRQQLAPHARLIAFAPVVIAALIGAAGAADLASRHTTPPKESPS
jgi:hypothetical protein